MENSKFVYVTYIKTTPEALWKALTDNNIIPQYFAGATQESAWTPGSSWKMVLPDGKVCDSGEVIEIEPCKKLVLKWRSDYKQELHDEGYSLMTYEIEEEDGNVKLTVLHEIDVPRSKLILSVSGGWPYFLSSLKSLLETGEPLGNRQKSCTA